MVADDVSKPLSDDGKSPQVHQAESGEATFNKGDDAVKVEDAKTKLIGLTKEQLEAYRNDPFWKPVRIIMLILFWVIWVAMFAAAVLIVLLSPKCQAKKDPEWWKVKVSYQIFTPTFRDSNSDGVGDFNGIKEKLDELRKIGVNNIWATPVVAVQKDDFVPYDVINLSEPDNRFGTMDDLKDLVSELHSRNMHFVMDFPISTTSVEHQWFIDAKADGKHHDYYIWERMGNGSETYLTYNKKNPILNWKNNDVKKSIVDSAKKYLDIGVDGFHVSFANQLGKNLGSSAKRKTALEELEYFSDEIRKYADSVEELKGKAIAVFTTLNYVSEARSTANGANFTSVEYIIDNSMNELDEEKCASSMASCLCESLMVSLQRFARTNLPHVWQITDYDVSRPTSRFGVARGNLLTFVQLCLPGAVEVYYGQEIGMTDTVGNGTAPFTGLMQWDNSEHAGFSSVAGKTFFKTTSDYETVNFKSQYEQERSPLKTFRILAKLRERDETMALGEIRPAPCSKDILIFSRHEDAGNQTVGSAFLIIANFGMIDHSVDIRSAVPPGHSAHTVEVSAVTSNVEKYRPREKLDLSQTLVTLNPNQGILLKL